MTTPTLLRSQVADLTTLASRDLHALWRSVEHAADAAQPLRDILPGLVAVYGSAAATVAANWYDDLRAKEDIPKRFRAIPAEPPQQVGAEALVGWALSEAKDLSTFQSLVEGGLQRRIANVARGTVMGSSVADPAAQGWQRVSRGRCHGGFCDMIAARGAVYRTEDSATFGAHDHCQCVAVMAWSGRKRPVRPYEVSSRRQIGPDGNPLPISEADRKRVKDWIASNLP